MVVIHREAGLRFVIYANDHKPAHLHVYGDGEAKIELFGPSGEPLLLYAVGMSKSDLRRAMRIVNDRKSEFLAGWSALHG